MNLAESLPESLPECVKEAEWNFRKGFDWGVCSEYQPGCSTAQRPRECLGTGWDVKAEQACPECGKCRSRFFVAEDTAVDYSICINDGFRSLRRLDLSWNEFSLKRKWATLKISEGIGKKKKFLL